MISVYADGSSGGRSDAPGGYGWVIVRDGAAIMAGYGGSVSTTNNRMEVQGAIAGLTELMAQGLHLEGPVELVSDSQYTLGVGAGRYHPVKNLDLAVQLRDLCQRSGVSFRWVRGHSKEPWNEGVDALAKRGKQDAKERVSIGEG